MMMRVYVREEKRGKKGGGGGANRRTESRLYLAKIAAVTAATTRSYTHKTLHNVI